MKEINTDNLKQNSLLLNVHKNSININDLRIVINDFH